jgi:hypothetical protein
MTMNPNPPVNHTNPAIHPLIDVVNIVVNIMEEIDQAARPSAIATGDKNSFSSWNMRDIWLSSLKPIF